MRIFLRLLIFWAISATAFYLYGKPMLMDFIQNRTRADAYRQCLGQLNEQDLIGKTLTAAQGDDYCHCVTDPLMFDDHDLLDAMQRKQPGHITAQAKELAEQCDTTLQQAISGTVAKPQAAGPAPDETKPDGTQVIHF